MFLAEDIELLDKWLDENVGHLYKEQPLAQMWARLSKVGEEYGEAVDALIGETGQNPRKGLYGEPGDVDKELVDVALTAILCLQHRTKDIGITVNTIVDRMIYRKEKAGLI